MKKLLPILLIVVGLVGGIGAGVMLKPAPEPEEPMAKAACDPNADCNENEYIIADPPKAPVYDPDAVWDYVKMPKQFVVPVIKKDRVSALVVMSLSLEVTEGQSEFVLSKTPKLRDGFLQVLFNHANSGGFDGAFTTGRSMKDLRGELKETAQTFLGENVESVLIEEIVKQAM